MQRRVIISGNLFYKTKFFNNSVLTKYEKIQKLNKMIMYYKTKIKFNNLKKELIVLMRDNKVQIRFTREERDYFMKYCMEKGITLSSEIRQLLYRKVMEDTMVLMNQRRNNKRKESVNDEF